MANRLKQVLGTLVHKDQSYCIPGRMIMDQFFFNVVDISVMGDLVMGLLSLDQGRLLIE